MRGFTDGRFRAPIQELLGIRILEVQAGHCVAEMPASEWLQAFDNTVSLGSLGATMNLLGAMVGQSSIPRATTVGGLEGNIGLLRSVPADG